MDGKVWHRVKDIVDSALQQDPRTWPAFVETSCRGDEELMSEVTSLLEASRRVGDFIEVPILELLRQRSGLVSAVGMG